MTNILLWMMLFYFSTANASSIEEKSDSEDQTSLLKDGEKKALSVENEEKEQEPILGVGLGFVHLLHIDYRRPFKEELSFELSVTPLLMLNVVTFGVSKQVPLTYTAQLQRQLSLSGGVMGIVGIMDGSPALGPNIRFGYERLGKRFGYRLYLGGGVVWTSLNEITVMPDCGFSILRVKRKTR